MAAAAPRAPRLANAMNGLGGGWRVPSSTHSSAVWRPTYQIHKLLLPRGQRTPPQPGSGTGEHATNGVDVGGASQGEITLQIVDRNELKAFGQQACVVGVVQRLAAATGSAWRLSTKASYSPAGPARSA